MRNNRIHKMGTLLCLFSPLASSMPRKRINASGFACTEDGCSFVNCSSFTSSGDNCKFVNCSDFTNAGDNCNFVNCNGVDLGDNSTSVNSHLTEASGGTKKAKGSQKGKKTTTGGDVTVIRTQGGQTFDIGGGGGGGTGFLSNIGIVSAGCEVNGIVIPRAASLIWGVPHFRGHPLTRENNARLFEERPDLVVFLDEVERQQRHAAPVPAAASGSVSIGRVVLGRRREMDRRSSSDSSSDSSEEEETPPRSRSKRSRTTPQKRPTLTALTKDEEYIFRNPDKDTDHPEVKEEDVCVVCSSRGRNTVIMDCAHSCACLICMHKIHNSAVEKGEDGKCPMCNTKFTYVTRIFKS